MDVYNDGYTYGDDPSRLSMSSFRKISLPSYNSGIGSGSGSSWRRSKRWRLNVNWNVKAWFRRRRSSSVRGSSSGSPFGSVKGRVQVSRDEWTSRGGWGGNTSSTIPNTPVWRYLRITFISVLLTWSIYCTIRYFMSITVYDTDPLRRRIAISLGTLTTLSTLFFALETIVVYALSMHLFIPLHLRAYIHFLTYFASFLVITPALVNVGVIAAWRYPHSVGEFERTIRGRCVWDVDAVWTGTGMECSGAEEVSFGVWIGAGVVRLLATLVVVCLYFVVARYFPRADEEPVPIPIEAANQMTELTLSTHHPTAHHAHDHDSESDDAFTPPTHAHAHAYLNQPHSLSSAQILRHIKAMSVHDRNRSLNRGRGRSSFSGSGSDGYDDDDDYEYEYDEDEYGSDLGDFKSPYARVLTDEPDHRGYHSHRMTSSLSLPLSQLSLPLPLNRSDSRATGQSVGVVGGPRPIPKSKPSLASLSRASTFSTSMSSTITTTTGTGGSSTLGGSVRDTPTQPQLQPQMQTQIQIHGHGQMHGQSEDFDSHSLLSKEDRT